MPRAAAGLLVVGLLGTLLVGTAGSTSCAAALEWRGETYLGLGEGVTSTISVGDRVGTGTAPPCGEATRGCAAPDPRRLTVRRFEGMDPAIAVAVEGDPGVYVVPGYVAADPRHPLHGTVYPPAQRARERRGWTCGTANDHHASVGAHPEAPLRLDDGRSPRIESRTIFVGLDRHGVAYLQEGQRLLVRTVRCETRRGRTKDVATRIQLLSGP